MGQSQSAEIPSCLMIYVHTFSETIKNETKIKGTRKKFAENISHRKKKVRMYNIKKNISTE